APDAGRLRPRSGPRRHAAFRIRGSRFRSQTLPLKERPVQRPPAGQTGGAALSSPAPRSAAAAEAAAAAAEAAAAAAESAAARAQAAAAPAAAAAEAAAEAATE